MSVYFRLDKESKRKHSSQFNVGDLTLKLPIVGELNLFRPCNKISSISKAINLFTLIIVFTSRLGIKHLIGQASFFVY